MFDNIAPTCDFYFYTAISLGNPNDVFRVHFSNNFPGDVGPTYLTYNGQSISNGATISYVAPLPDYVQQNSFQGVLGIEVRWSSRFSTGFGGTFYISLELVSGPTSAARKVRRYAEAQRRMLAIDYPECVGSSPAAVRRG